MLPSDFLREVMDSYGCIWLSLVRIKAVEFPAYERLGLTIQVQPLRALP